MSATEPFKPRVRRTSKLAVTGALLAFCLGPVGLVLSVISIVRIRRDPFLKGLDFAIGGVVISLLWFAWAALALPGFFKFQARAKQTECKNALKTIRSQLREDPGREIATLELEPPKRYAYVFAAGELVSEGAARNVILPEPSAQTLEAVASVSATLPLGRDAQGWKVACVGNIDGDDTLDVWLIDTSTGEMENPVDDLAD